MADGQELLSVTCSVTQSARHRAKFFYHPPFSHKIRRYKINPADINYLKEELTQLKENSEHDNVKININTEDIKSLKKHNAHKINKLTVPYY